MIILSLSLLLMLLVIMLGIAIQLKSSVVLQRGAYFIDQDLSFYQVQQQQINADIAAGHISLEQAHQHQMHLSHQVLSVQAPTNLGYYDALPKRYYLLMFTILLSFSVIFYGLWGQYWGIARLQKQVVEHRWVTQSLHRMGGMSGLVASLQRRVKTYPNEPPGWYFLGRINFDQKNYQLAYAHLQRAYRLAPDNVRYRLAYAMASIQVKHPLERPISQWLKALIKTNGDGVVAARQLLAMDAHYRGDYSQALVHWRALLAVLPADDPMAKQVLLRIQDELNAQHS